MTNTKIQWCDSTHSEWSGCSGGCSYCYARRQVKRFGGDFSKLRLTSEANRRKPYAWNKRPWVCDECGTPGTVIDRGFGQCLKCHKNGMTSRFHRRRVFCGSMMDWLDQEANSEWLEGLLKTVSETPNLDWLLLTKQPCRWRSLVGLAYMAIGDKRLRGPLDAWLSGEPWPHVMTGTTCEDQQAADKRIPELLRIPGRHFLSLEPLLGPIDLRLGVDVALSEIAARQGKTVPMIHWVIVGGGNNAGPCNIEWIRNILGQCRAAGVPCFVKQLGSNPILDGSEGFWTDTRTHSRNWSAPSEWPADLRVREFP